MQLDLCGYKEVNPSLGETQSVLVLVAMSKRMGHNSQGLLPPRRTRTSEKNDEAKEKALKKKARRLWHVSGKSVRRNDRLQETEKKHGEIHRQKKDSKRSMIKKLNYKYHQIKNPAFRLSTTPMEGIRNQSARLTARAPLKKARIAKKVWTLSVY